MTRTYIAVLLIGIHNYKSWHANHSTKCSGAHVCNCAQISSHLFSWQLPTVIQSVYKAKTERDYFEWHYRLPGSVYKFLFIRTSETLNQVYNSSPGNHIHISEVKAKSSFFKATMINRKVYEDIVAHFGGRRAFWISSLFNRRDRSVLVIFVIGRLPTQTHTQSLQSTVDMYTQILIKCATSTKRYQKSTRILCDQ